MQKGFTLVELAISLVLIGLLVGGILVGTTMLRTTEINSTLRDFNMLDTAAHTFRTRHGGLPGDFRTATKLFGPTAESGAMNGDGDKRIRYSPPGAINEVAELFRHLQLAGLIKGAYGGASYLPNLPLVMESDSGAHYEIAWRSMPFGGSEKNLFYIGVRQESGPHSWDGAFTADEAYLLDYKMDDGIPSMGRARAETPHWRPYTECVSTDPGAGFSRAEYRREETRPSCMMLIKSSL